jgi:hypothetical protein
MRKKDRIVSQRPNGTWANTRSGAERAGSVHDTQKDAAAEAKEMLQKTGSGELIIKGVDGKIRSKDTIAPGDDPIRRKTASINLRKAHVRIRSRPSE